MSLTKHRIKPVFFSLLFIVFGGAQAFAQGVAERFADHDPTSKVKVDHDPLTDFLQVTVLPVGRSYRVMGNEKADTYRGSRIKTAKSLSPARFEGSRILVHAFTGDHIGFFRAYQLGLERLSNRRPLKELNKNEQLAYWLNLYNVIVINKIVQEYPIETLKKLRKTKRGKASFWDEKITTVEGVPLSLKDIETILFTNFDSPEVAFGLWQGSVGGPRLLNYAFNGTNVRRALENNAYEFVNSNRGLRPPMGSRMNVSDFYEWMMPAFGTSEDHVLSFIREYSDPNFVSVSGVSSLNFKIYDWKIADLMGGTKHGGQGNQLGGLQASHGGGTTSPGSWGAVASIVPGEGGGNIAGYDATAIFDMVLALTPTGPLEGLPTHASELLMGIKMNTRQPITLITTVECEPGDDCEVEDLDNE